MGMESAGLGIETRVFTVGEASLKIPFRFDEKCRRYIGEIPDFEQEPVYTAEGKPWVSAVQDMCTCGEDKEFEPFAGRDCGACRFFVREKEDDIIGVCDCKSRWRAAAELKNDRQKPIHI